MSASRPFSIKRLVGRNNEGVLVVVLLILIIGMSIANPAFFSPQTLFAILRSSIVPMIFALGVLIVIISGGIDVSFAAIAIFAAYTTVRILLGTAPTLNLAFAFVIAMVIGALLGLFNGLVISRFQLPTLIVTLGTQGIFKGALLAYVGSAYIAELPESLRAIEQTNIASVQTDVGMSYLHVMVIPAVVLCLLVAFMLNKTMFGRSIYAMGTDIEAARRAGIKVVRNQTMVYVIVGVMAAAAGLISLTMGRSASPQDLVGGELDIIAAVVLGGASIFGGRGSVTGTVLGVLLVQVINNSLILAGVPSAWQRAAVGLLLILGVGIQALARKRGEKRMGTVDTVEVSA